MTGPAGAAGPAATPDAQVPAWSKEFKAELDALRDRVRRLGLPDDETAAEIARRYQVRAREAYRLTQGWTLRQAVARFNARAARHDTGPEARVSLTHTGLAEVERWPLSPCKPSVDALFLLADIYETDVLCLLDLADHESLPHHDRQVLLRRKRAATPFGETLVALLEARGLSAGETARRVPCSAGYLCNVIHGRKRPSRQVAARLDEVLDAGGELVTLARAAEVVTSGEAAAPGAPRGQAPGARVGAGEGFSLALPYVPGRLVIEVSGPAGDTGQLADSGDEHAVTGGQLALLPGPARGTAVAGA
jgi:transcriptional regulator with XRE-family HTH domain